MNLFPLLVAAVAVLPMFALAAWVWFAMASAEEDLRLMLFTDAERAVP